MIIATQESEVSSSPSKFAFKNGKFVLKNVHFLITSILRQDTCFDWSLNLEEQYVTNAEKAAKEKSVKPVVYNCNVYEHVFVCFHLIGQ